MNRRENEKMYGFYAPPSLMKQFQATAAAQDLNMSQLIRRLARQEILRAAKEAAQGMPIKTARRHRSAGPSE